MGRANADLRLPNSETEPCVAVSEASNPDPLLTLPEALRLPQQVANSHDVIDILDTQEA